MRDQKGECSFVSLRDVERSLQVHFVCYLTFFLETKNCFCYCLTVHMTIRTPYYSLNLPQGSLTQGSRTLSIVMELYSNIYGAFYPQDISWNIILSYS